MRINDIRNRMKTWDNPAQYEDTNGDLEYLLGMVAYLAEECTLPNCGTRRWPVGFCELSAEPDEDFDTTAKRAWLIAADTEVANG